MRFLEILVAATAITGLIWLLDRLFWRPKRLMPILQKKSGAKPLDKEPLIVEYSRAFFPILLLVLILRSFLAEPFRIPSGSMHPTLLEGDFILVNKYHYGLRLPISGTKVVNTGQPKRGDVIVFKHVKRGESMDMIKRVVGLPGDRIEYKDNTVHINGAPVKMELITETLDKEPGQNMGWPVKQYIETLGDVRHDTYVWTDSESNRGNAFRYNNVVVPESSYFVMGDNRDNSDDSRYWGFVKDEDILGHALLIWLSFDTSKKGMDCVRNCIRWNRIGDTLSLNNKMSEKQEVSVKQETQETQQKSDKQEKPKVKEKT